MAVEYFEPVEDTSEEGHTMSPIEVTVRTVVDLLARKEYETVERMTQGIRMSAKDIAEAIAAYGRTLTPPDPSTWWPLVTVTPVTGESGKYHVAAPLWTKEEGPSDLTVELWLNEFAPELFRPALLNIHVL
jgi:hypothetical protein